jgi:LPS-assembly protein
MKNSRKLQVTVCRLIGIVIFVLFTACHSLFTAEAAVTITADNLEHFAEDDKFLLTGNVVIVRDNGTLKGDNVIYYRKTEEASAKGNVIYEDSLTVINSSEAKLNLDTKKGQLYNAAIYFKKDNFRINSDNIKKINENHYFANNATITTCDSEPAENSDWCFKGSNVDIVIGQKFTASNATFRIKNTPVLYSPYIWGAVKTDRQTGFLSPLIGSSSEKGFRFSPAFFWAIDDNKDATVGIDYFSKRGVGKNIEYRYIEPEQKGQWYAYHISDSHFKKDYYEVRGFSDYDGGIVKAFADVNYVNQRDFYREYGFENILRTDRLLQSSAEISLPLSNSRAYLLGQYWIDMKAGQNLSNLRKLPELGYVLNTTNVGPVLFSMDSDIANFYKNSVTQGQRLTVRPALSYAAGDVVRIFQSLSLNESFYDFENNPAYKAIEHSQTLQYRVNALSRFYKKYDGFIHIIEPSLSYRYISKNNFSLPIFDAIEYTGKSSVATASIYNLFRFKDFSIAARLSQPYDLNAGNKPLLPTIIEASMNKPEISFNISAAYDFNKGSVETANSDISFKAGESVRISFGTRIQKDINVQLFKSGIESVVSKDLHVLADMSYDPKSGGVRESAIRAVYKQQCWTGNIAVIRRPADQIRPADYSFLLTFELKGIGKIKAL